MHVDADDGPAGRHRAADATARFQQCSPRRERPEARERRQRRRDRRLAHGRVVSALGSASWSAAAWRSPRPPTGLAATPTAPTRERFILPGDQSGRTTARSTCSRSGPAASGRSSPGPGQSARSPIALTDACSSAPATTASSGSGHLPAASSSARCAPADETWSRRSACNGRRVAVGAEDGSVRVWRLPLPAALATLRPASSHVGTIRSVSFAASGLLASAVGRTGALAYDTAAGRVVAALPANRLRAASVSADGSRIAVLTAAATACACSRCRGPAR